MNNLTWEELITKTETLLLFNKNIIALKLQPGCIQLQNKNKKYTILITSLPNALSDITWFLQQKDIV